MRVKFEYKEKNMDLFFSKINIFFGYNSVGKTFLSKLFHDGFIQKNKKIFMVDGKQVSKNDFELIYLNSKDSIEDHFKLNAKSLLTKSFMPDIITAIHEDNKFEEFLFKKFNELNEKLIFILKEINEKYENKLMLNIDYETIETLILSIIKVNFYEKDFSDSHAKNFLYDIVNEYIKKANNTKIVIIDDFDLYFDEKATMDYLKNLEELENTTFFLFTGKGTSLPYSFDRYGIFAMQEKKIVDLTNVKKMIQYVLTNKDEENFSFEDYITSQGMILTKFEYEEMKRYIQKNININLSRMLINKDYSFDYKNEISIKIIPNSIYEEKYLKYIDTILKE